MLQDGENLEILILFIYLFIYFSLSLSSLSSQSRRFVGTVLPFGSFQWEEVDVLQSQ